VNTDDEARQFLDQLRAQISAAPRTFSDDLAQVIDQAVNNAISKGLEQNSCVSRL